LKAILKDLPDIGVVVYYQDVFRHRSALRLARSAAWLVANHFRNVPFAKGVRVKKCDLPLYRMPAIFKKDTDCERNDTPHS
jgi:hypothetical protein